MSCTHDCGCTPETRDARADDWGQIAPESARAATQEPRTASDGTPAAPDACAPVSGPLPRRIEPEDVRVGMVVERRKGESYVGGRVKSIDAQFIEADMSVVWDFVAGYADYGWSLWLIEDAPAPVDPDADVIERVAQVLHKQGCSWCDTGEDLEAHYGSAREAWREDARAVLAVVREHTVTPRAEQ